MKSVLNIKMCKCLVSNYVNFHPLEFVGRDSVTQLQVGEIYIYCTYLKTPDHFALVQVIRCSPKPQTLFVWTCALFTYS